MKKTLAMLVVLVIAGFFGWQVYRRASMPKGEFVRRPPSLGVAVKVSPVEKATVFDRALFTGSLLPNTYYVVAPKIAGRLEKLAVDIGDSVKRGQLIAVLDDDEYEQQIDQARAELEVARANVVERRSNLGIARRGYDRAKALRQKKIISESELDNARAQFEAEEAKYRVAQAQVTQKEAALRAATVRLSYTKIRAAWENGTERRIIGERFVDEGSMLKANDPIVSVLDIHSLTGVIHVIEQDYSKVRTGQDAIVTTDAFPSKTFTGKILRVAPLLKETSRQARVEIEIPNPDGILKPGMFVRVQIEFAEHKNVTVVPLSALVKRNGQRGVFLADTQNMKAHFVPVTVGIIDHTLAEVVKPSLSGLVVTLGHHLLEDGSAIIMSSLESVKPTSQPINLESLSGSEKTESQGTR
ncbi:MAG: efflux RND transporter periplasmic adaptor subunit [Proteobacteria bacterium]|nr:efflux RND transporter periplasmic adaptor subunit [Pseudomonadota bacterium]NIS68084.1 efflux RND transporter periplasmic adaptor subunit [Pseudomonadota bacterium]